MQTQEKPTRVSLSAFVDRDQHERLVALAKLEDSSVARVVRRALERELDRQPKETA